MINFFRKIRKQLADDNKPLKYMRYAIGEIVLVVLGILIALSINNWNEEQKERVKLNNIFQIVKADLVKDTLGVSQFIKRVGKHNTFLLKILEREIRNLH